MIAEKAEQLMAVLQGKRILTFLGCNKVNISTIAPLALLALGLLLLIDYGYMVYLHFQMVSQVEILKDRADVL